MTGLNEFGNRIDMRRYAWFVVGLLWVVALLNYLDRQIIFSVLPLVRADLHLSNVQLGLLSTVFLKQLGGTGLASCDHSPDQEQSPDFKLWLASGRKVCQYPPELISIQYRFSIAVICLGQRQ